MKILLALPSLFQNSVKSKAAVASRGGPFSEMNEIQMKQVKKKNKISFTLWDKF